MVARAKVTSDREIMVTLGVLRVPGLRREVFQPPTPIPHLFIFLGMRGPP